MLQFKSTAVLGGKKRENVGIDVYSFKSNNPI